MTFVMVLSLGVGVGINSTLFGLVKGVLYPDFPYRGVDRVVVVSETKHSGHELTRYGLTRDEFLTWQSENDSLEALAVVQFQERLGLSGFGRPQVVDGRRVSADFFRVLGTAPEFGRLFDQADSGRSLAVISYQFWNTHMGRLPDAVGATIRINGVPVEIVGVAGKDFHFLYDDSDLWLRALPNDHHQQLVIGRVRPGLPVEQAEERLRSLHEYFQSEHRERREIRLEAISDYYRAAQLRSSDLLRQLPIAYALIAFILLLAISNVASLLFTRMLSRNDEFSVRLALGASRRRLALLTATEGGVTALLGGAAAVLLVLILFQGLSQWWSDLLPGSKPQVGSEEIFLSFGLSLGIGTILTLSATWMTSRLPLSLDRRDRRLGTKRGFDSKLSHGILLFQVALACSLLSATAVLGKSFWNLLTVDPGFNPDNVLFVDLRLPESRYVVSDEQTAGSQVSLRQEAFVANVIRQLEVHPDVEAVGASNDLMSQAVIVYELEGKPNDEPIPTVALYRAVTPDFFEAMGIPAFRGSLFGPNVSRPSSEPVIIVNRGASRVLWPPGQPAGRLLIGSKRSPKHIVGVVADTRHAALDRTPRTTFYVPYQQLSFDYKGLGVLRLSVMLVVRYREGMRQEISEAVRAAVHSADPELPVYSMQSARERFSEQLSGRTFLLAVLMAVAAISLLLVLIGIFGLTSAMLKQRRREIGVRIAVGASGRQILYLLLKPPLRLVLGGLIIGSWGGFALAKTLGDFLYQVEPTDLASHLVTGLLIAATVAVTSYMAARQARSINPSELLRSQ